MSGEIGSLPVYTITVGQSGTFTNDATVNIAPIVNAEIADAPVGDQIVVLFEPGTYGENTPILIGSNTSVIGNDSTLSHIGTIANSDNGALIANKDDYNLGGKYYVTNTDGTTVTLTSPTGTTNWLAADPGTPIVDTNMLVEGMTFLSTGGNTFANQAYNNFGTWFSDAENVAVQNNTYIGGTDGNAFVNVVNGIVANNIAVGQTNAAYDNWNGPVNITIEDNTSFMGKGASTGWSVLINSTPTGDAANPGNAVNDGIVDNQFASAYEYSAATNTDALLSYGITYEQNITQQGNVDSLMNSPDGQGFFAANVDGSVIEDNTVTDPVTTSGDSNNIIANRTSSNTQPAEATNGNVIGNLVFGGTTNGGSSAITNQGSGTNTVNNAVLGGSTTLASPISNINYTGSDATTGSIQAAGGTLSGSGVTPALDITAPPTLFVSTATPDLVAGLAINDPSATDSLSVTLTTTFGTLSLAAGDANVTYGTYGGQNGILLTGTSAEINAELAGLTYTSNAAGYDDAIEVNVSDPSSLSATRYIPVTVGNFGVGQDQVVTIPAGVLIPMQTVASEFPGQTLPATPNLGGEIVIAAAGDNVITMGSTVSMAFLGTGANTVEAGSAQEYIATESGPSTIDLEQGGDVTVAGGAGALNVNAATGDNLLELGSSDASVSLGGGANSVIGGLGDATIQGGAGPVCIATLPQDNGAMNIDLGTGNATIYALSGNDVIQTQTNTSNIIYAGLGNDSIMSGGNDAIFTGAGADTVNASGTGAASVFGGTGSLYFNGGIGVSTSYIDPADSTTIEAGSGDLIVGPTGTFVLKISLLDGTTRTISLPSLSGGVSLRGFPTSPIVTEYFASGTLDAVLSDGTQLAITDPTDDLLEVVNGNLNFTATLLPTQTDIIQVGALAGIAGGDPAAFESIVNQEIISLGSGNIDLLISNGSYDINGYQDVVDGTQFISALSAGQTIADRAGSTNLYYADIGNNQINSVGDDIVFAGAGDTVNASAGGSDTVYGSSGNLTFIGGSGSSVILPSESTSIEAGSGDLNIMAGGTFSLDINAETGSTRTITLPDLSAGVQLLGFAADAIEAQIFNGATLQVTLSDGTVLNLADQEGLSLVETAGQLIFSNTTLAQGSTLLDANASYNVTSGSGVISAPGGNHVDASGTSFSVITGVAGQDQVALLSTIGAVTTSGGANTILVAGNSDTVVSGGSDDLIVSSAVQAAITVSGFANIVETSGSDTINATGSGCVNVLVGTGQTAEVNFINSSSNDSTVTGVNGSVTVFGGIGGGYYQGGALGNNSLVGGAGLVTLVGSAAGGDTLVASGSVNGSGFNVLDAGPPTSLGTVTTGGSDVLQSTSSAGTTYFILNAGNDQVSASGGGIQYINFNPIGEATVVGSNAAVMNQFYLSQSANEGGTTDMISNFDLARDNFSLINTSNLTISSVANEQNFGELTGAVINLSNGSKIELVGVSLTQNQMASIVGTTSF